MSQAAETQRMVFYIPQAMRLEIDDLIAPKAGTVPNLGHPAAPRHPTTQRDHLPLTGPDRRGAWGEEAADGAKVVSPRGAMVGAPAADCSMVASGMADAWEPDGLALSS